MKTTQATLQDRFQRIDALHILLSSKIITQHDFWLLTGAYKIIWKDRQRSFFRTVKRNERI